MRRDEIAEVIVSAVIIFLSGIMLGFVIGMVVGS